MWLLREFNSLGWESGLRFRIPPILFMAVLVFLSFFFSFFPLQSKDQWWILIEMKSMETNRPIVLGLNLWKNYLISRYKHHLVYFTSILVHKSDKTCWNKDYDGESRFQVVYWYFLNTYLYISGRWEWRKVMWYINWMKATTFLRGFQPWEADISESLCFLTFWTRIEILSVHQAVLKWGRVLYIRL